MNSINNNFMALNVANTLDSHYGRLSTSVQRLSTGLRINSAADDASGLAIRELMRADVAALHQGGRNANDAISLLQVADGALAIIDEKLIRMKELAEQAATGTYDSTQRLMIHSEYIAMADEIDRIARATDFNGIKLLDGSLSGTHDGKGLVSTGSMKIHFGPGNDSAEDYYFIEIGACTTEALGLGKVPALIRVEKEVEVTQTYNFQNSYVEYTDPDSGRKYYSDGNIYFSSTSNPLGTALDSVADRVLIEKLRTTQVTSRESYLYDVYMDPDTGREYYKTARRVYADPYNPGSSALDELDPSDKAIIDRLQPKGTSLEIKINWAVYEDPQGLSWYTNDNGVTFSRYPQRPDENVLDSNNPADKPIIDTLTPKLVTATISQPAVHVTYKCYKDPQTNKMYYSADNGRTFTGNTTKPEDNLLDGNKDSEIINRLEPVVREEERTEYYDIYEDKDTGQEYFSNDGGMTFIQDRNDPGNVVLDVSNPADAAQISKLEVAKEIKTGTIKCDIYQDAANGYKQYYTWDNGQTFFSDTNDPDGSLLDKNDPNYNSLVANFQKINATANILIDYETYIDPDTRKKYYTKDGGQTFALDINKWDNTALDASNPADLAAIRNLKPVAVQARVDLGTYVRWVDPLTKRTYYTQKDSPGSGFTSSLKDPDKHMLDPAKPADKAVLDRLEIDQVKQTASTVVKRPDVYYIYEDSVSGKIYYSTDDGKTFSSSASDPYNTRLDPTRADHKLVIDRLRPVSGGTKTVITYEKVENGGGLSISTQESAQQSLAAIDRAIVSKDKVRAHLGALQNRLENTVANLNIQAENLLTAESRISDADVAAEMTQFVRNQVLTQSAVAMLGQANSYPHMLSSLIQS